jgi:copper chaperone NosL
MHDYVKRLMNITTVVLLAIPVALWAADPVQLPDGSKLDLSSTCPVCNMKMEGSPLGYAAVVFKDGKVMGFDGPGDMFRYFLEPAKYGFDASNVKNVYVSEYGTRKFIDGKTAFFVIGADISGPMGPEVAPFAAKEAADKFQSEHQGKRIGPYTDVKLDDLKSQKKMLKMKHEGMGGGN